MRQRKQVDMNLSSTRERYWAMTDRPILFSAPMVRAIIREIENPGAGKNQTRRILNPQPKTFDI